MRVTSTSRNVQLTRYSTQVWYLINKVATFSFLFYFKRQTTLLPPLALVFCVDIYAQIARHFPHTVEQSTAVFHHNGQLVCSLCHMSIAVKPTLTIRFHLTVS